MQFFQLGTKVKFRAHQDQPYVKGNVVGCAFIYRDSSVMTSNAYRELGSAHPVYLIELAEGFYCPEKPSNPLVPCPPATSPHYISTLVVSCDCVEADE